MEYDYSGPKGLISRNHWMKGNERVKEDEEAIMWPNSLKVDSAWSMEPPASTSIQWLAWLLSIDVFQVKYCHTFGTVENHLNCCLVEMFL